MSETSRILIVEDRDDFQETFKEYILDLDPKIEIDIASNLIDGLSLLSRKLYSVAMVDLRLDEKDDKNMDGYKILEHVRKLNEGTKVIVLTAYGNLSDSSKSFREFEVFDFIGKNEMTPESVKQQVFQAIQSAKNDMERPSIGGLDINTLLKVTSLSDVLGMLYDNKENEKIEERYRRLEELRFFLMRLLKPILPVLPSKENISVQGKEKGKSDIIEILSWSKELGRPVAIIFGNFTKLKSMSDKVIEVNPNYDVVINSLFDDRSFPHFAGFIIGIKNAEFNNFNS